MPLNEKAGATSQTSDAQHMSAAEAYRNGMRWLAAGVCLITCKRGTEYGGMIATAVTSVSADPPTLLICINRGASLFSMIEETGVFCVNVLGEQGVELVEQFSSSARRAERFQTGDWSSMPSGAPMCGEALVAFDCRVARLVDWHTHGIFLGEVEAVFQPRPDATPLLYMDRRFHHLSERPVTK